VKNASILGWVSKLGDYFLIAKLFCFSVEEAQEITKT